MRKLTKDFYLREDVVQISRDLLGKVLITEVDNHLCGGIITETEAYAGISDKASHAYGGRRTSRTEIMYAEGGVSYVYLCYGIHHLFNVITNAVNIPEAVLIRAIKPHIGISEMLKRRKQANLTNKICIGPGNVSQALGIKQGMNGLSLSGSKVWIEDHGFSFQKDQIKTGPRVGVAYAGEDAKLPYRYWVW